MVDGQVQSGCVSGRTSRWQLPALTVTITYALIQMVKKIVRKSDKVRVITKSRVTELIMSGGACLMNVWISATKTDLLT